MRQDVVEFERFNVAATKEPRYVIKLEYSVSSPHFTSKKGIANVPGVPVQGVLSKLSANSQQLFPEQGRTTIGGFSFETTDLVGAVTDELRTQLQTNDEGIRGRTVEVFKGFSDDFDDPEWLLINTYIVANVSHTGVGYRFQLTDITREMNDVVFEKKTTTLTLSISDSDSIFTVDDTTDFITVFHPNSFTDGPGLTVGYLTMSSGEIVRYTGKTPTTFTGVARGRFGTRAQAIEVDATTPTDRQPKVEEFIYLEMPGPMLAYAIITGDILGTSPQAVLPAHWHTDVPQSFVRLSDFNNIGDDLFDPNDVTKGLILRFTHLGKTNGKAFVEKQIHLLQGTFSPIYSTGEVGIKRSNRILADAPFVKKLTDANITKLGALKHDQSKVINRFRIDWNWDGEDFTRRNLFIDNDSITTHGEAAIKVLEFRGLNGSRHTLPTLRQLVDTLRDRFSGPPEIIQINVLPSLEVIEVGDVVRITTSALRDYAGAATLDRSFEVQRRQEDLETGQVILSCFGSSQAKTDQSPTTANPALPDSFYPQEGVDLDSLAEVTGGAITSDLTLTGGTDMNAPANVWFHLGNLTLNVGITLTIVGNVQLRIRGFFTVNGTIDGIGNGIAGSVDGTSIGAAPTRTPAGTGYVGTTRSGDGLEFEGPDPHLRTLPGITVQPPRSNFPQLQLEVIVGSPLTQLNGIPTDLRGSGGSHGAQVVNDLSDLVGPLTIGIGGTGGDGGAGLALICRGLGTGASGTIDLSGDDGTAPAFVTGGGIDMFPGSGAGGGTGSWLVLLDGSSVTFPVLAGDFLSQIGVTTIQGTPGVPGGIFLFFPGPEPFSGLAEAANFSAVDYSNSTLRIQFVPQDTAADTDVAALQLPPTNLVIVTLPLGNSVLWANPSEFDLIQIFASETNDRTVSVKVGETKSAGFFHELSPGQRRFYWIRAVNADGDLSTFENGGASPETTTSAFGTSGAEGIIHDPYFSAPIDEEWEAKSSQPGDSPPPAPPTANISIIAGGGELGANALRMDVPDNAAFFVGFGPVRKFAISPGEIYICRFRLRLSASVTSLFIRLRIFDQVGNFIQTTGGGGLNVFDFINDGPGLGVWATAEMQIDTRISAASPSPFGPDNTAVGELLIDASDSSSQSPEANIDFDFISLSLGPQIFAGSNRLSGLVPPKALSTLEFLRDDGNWADPGAAGGPSLPVGAVDHDMAYFSAVPSPDAWVLSSALTGASDFVRFGSPTGLNVRLYRNRIEARGLIGQIPANLQVNPDGGVVQFGSNVGFATEIRTVSPGGINFVNFLSGIFVGGVLKIGFDNVPDRILLTTDVLINKAALANSALIIGEETTVRGAAQDALIALWGEAASTLREFRITNFGDIVRFAMQTGLTVEWQGDGDWLFDLRDGAKLRIRNAGDTDTVEFFHNDTSFVATFVNTLHWRIENITDLQLVDTTTSPDTIRTVLTDVDVKRSIEIDATDLQLDGDAAAPGASRYYGTDASSPPAKGFFVLPTGGAGEKRSIELDAGDHQLVGDVDSPGNNRVYGTNAGGTRVWKADPGSSTAAHDKSTARVQVASTAETQVMEVDFASGDLAVGDLAEFVLMGSQEYALGTPTIYRIRIGTQVASPTIRWQAVPPNKTNSDNNHRPVLLRFWVLIRGTDSIGMWGDLEMAATESPTTGKGDYERDADASLDPHSCRPISTDGLFTGLNVTTTAWRVQFTVDADSVENLFRREAYFVRLIN